MGLGWVCDCLVIFYENVSVGLVRGNHGLEFYWSVFYIKQLGFSNSRDTILTVFKGELRCRTCQDFVIDVFHPNSNFLSGLELQVYVESVVSCNCNLSRFLPVFSILHILGLITFAAMTNLLRDIL